MKGTRHHKRFVTLRSCAREALAHAEESREGSYFSGLSSVFASVFTLEAYLNHVGAGLEPDWEERGSWEPLKDKLKSICFRFSVDLDAASKEYQLLIVAMNARDYWVHGRTETTQEQTWNPNKRGTRPWKALTPQEELICVLPAPRHLLEHIERVVQRLHRAGGGSGDPFLNVGGGAGSE